jgi:signal transduction histidine kinase
MKTAEFILDALHQPVLILDGRLQPLIANPSFNRMFGIPPNALEKDFITGFISGAVCEPRLQTLLEPIIASGGEVDGAEVLCTLPTGQRLFLLVNARRIRTVDLPEMILIELRDISKERETEDRIQELNEALLGHVITVDAVNKELESFSHSVSHDLRTPLRFVNRIAHLLLHEPGARLSGTAAQQINMILAATGEMAKLIENLLALSQASQVPMKKRRLDPQKLFQEAAKELLQEQAGCDVEIIIQEMAPCQGDRRLLKEAVMNLLDNAIKFTGQQKDARITIGCTESAAETVYFIQDNGVGFDMNNMDALFVPFHRLHQAADFEGTGIGLALVKRIIERHGGRIWAEAETGKGATFYFTLAKVTPEQYATGQKDPKA